MRLSDLFRQTVNALAPRQCAVCGGRLAMAESVFCTRCGLHLPRTGHELTPADNTMASKFYGLMAIERAAALFSYQSGNEANLIIERMKYFHHPEIGEAMGRFMALDFAPHGFFEGIDLLVPIPLSPARQRQRGFNQSLEIARGVSQVTHIPIAAGAVSRIHFSQSQTTQSRLSRRAALDGAFCLLKPAQVAGRHVLIIDDVVTTGATITSCAKTLARAGDVRFSVLTIGDTKLG